MIYDDSNYWKWPETINLWTVETFNSWFILFDIDWQGTQQLSRHSELKLTKIFILPPNKDELKKRLTQRNQDKPDVVEERLKAYDSDSAHKNDYDFVVINDNLENCFKEVEKIILKKKDKKKF